MNTLTKAIAAVKTADKKVGTLLEAIEAIAGKASYTDNYLKDGSTRMKWYDRGLSIDAKLMLKELIEHPEHKKYLLDSSFDHQQGHGRTRSGCIVFKFIVNPNVIPYAKVA